MGSGLAAWNTGSDSGNSKAMEFSSLGRAASEATAENSDERWTDCAMDSHSSNASSNKQLKTRPFNGLQHVRLFLAESGWLNDPIWSVAPQVDQGLPTIFLPSGKDCYIATERCPLIVGLLIQNGDSPFRKLLVYLRLINGLCQLIPKGKTSAASCHVQQPNHLLVAATISFRVNSREHIIRYLSVLLATWLRLKMGYSAIAI